MKKFIVNSAILSSNLDPMACAVGAPKMLMNAGIKDVKIKSCYCCGAEGRSIFVVEAENREKLLEAMNKVNIPVASVMEAEEVKPKM
jgi:nitrate reductase NapAB chaperone NapD